MTRPRKVTARGGLLCTAHVALISKVGYFPWPTAVVQPQQVGRLRTTLTHVTCDNHYRVRHRERNLVQPPEFFTVQYRTALPSHATEGLYSAEREERDALQGKPLGPRYVLVDADRATFMRRPVLAVAYRVLGSNILSVDADAPVHPVLLSSPELSHLSSSSSEGLTGGTGLLATLQMPGPTWSTSGAQ